MQTGAWVAGGILLIIIVLALLEVARRRWQLDPVARIVAVLAPQ